jgi:plastocyanin
MRLTVMASVLALGALACGGKKAEQGSASQAAAQPEAAAQPSGPVIEIKMTGAGNVFQYEPNVINAPQGATLRFINVSGGPHNVSFYADSVPAGAVDQLNAAMPNRMDNLVGPFLINADDHYDIATAGLAKGTYKGFCTPHQALGMKFTLNIQ